jgi:hypothetical protein
MYEVMAQQTNLSQQALDFYKQAYADNQPRQAALDQMNLKVGESLLTDAQKARERGDEAYKYYQDNYRPVESRMIQDANTIDSESNIAGARGRALADVQQQAGLARDANMRSMSRFGLRPNANRLAGINSQLAAQVAATSAGAMQNAEQGQKDRGVAMRANVANVGRGYPAQAMAYGQQATGNSQAAYGNTMGANAANLQNQSFMGQGYNLAGNTNAQAMQGWGNIYGTQMQGYGIANSGNASNMAGFGSLAGLLGGAAISKWGADGGKITGPGTGTSDSIVAKNTDTGENIAVSNGEFVIPADVVRYKGTEFFDKLIEKHHVPAALQRRAAIKR